MSQPNTRKKSGRGARIAIGVLVGLIALAAIAYGVDYFVNKDKVPRGATVGGVAVGGMTPQEAQSTLERELGGAVADPVEVRAGQLATQLLPAESGLSINWGETVADAGEESLNPVSRILGLFREYEVDIVSDVDDAALQPALDRVQDELSREPVNATVALAGGSVETTEAVDGQNVDRAELNESVTGGWMNPEGVEIDAEITEPEIGDDPVQELAEGEAAAAVSGPIVAQGRDDIDGVIPVERMGEVFNFYFEDGSFRTEIDMEASQGILAENLGQTESVKQNAQITFPGGAKTVTPHSDGVEINWEETLQDFPDRVIGTADREFEVAYEEDPALFTTEMAQAATFDEVVGSFSTGGYSATSGHNISLTAQSVNGAIVAPGEVFSLNGFTGPRGTAQGYVEGGIILDGRADTAVGGGISQFATTLYNAAYFAGMEDVASTPHSYYISRYPAGREATVYEGAIDLQFRNTSDYPVRIEAGMGGGELTVRLVGQKTVEVESVNGGRWAQTSPHTIRLSGSDCSPSSGAPGFTTSDTRIIRDLAGNELSRETQTTVYDPQPIVRCS